jgi:hypothetical protein
MKLKCIDASDEKGTGKGLLTEGKIYYSINEFGGYYEILCDNGQIHTKDKSRFEYYQKDKNNGTI